MKTRTITQVEVYKLVLNSIYHRAESGTIVAISTDYDKLVDWYNGQLSEESYTDENGYIHYFNKNSILYSYNPCPSVLLNDLDVFDHGISNVWVDIEDYGNIHSIYKVE